MSRIIILIILISLTSCNKNKGQNMVVKYPIKTDLLQKKDSISNFIILSKIDEQIQLKTTTENTYITLDSLKNYIDGADAEYYIEVYKNAILNDSEKLKRHHIKSNTHIDYDVIDFFSQDYEVLAQILRKTYGIIGDHYDVAEVQDKDGYVNLRSGQNIKSTIVSKINSKELVKVINDEQDWWLVLHKDKSGYIHKSRLKVLDGY